MESNIINRRAIDAFLVDNPELEELNARLSEFNILGVLKAEKSELRHSNVLAWLLDPSANHGFGDKFLRRFISRFLLENNEIDVSLSPANVELMSLNDIEIYREWKNIDVFLFSRNNRFCLVIENKIGSKESTGQLTKYKNIIQEEFSGFEVIPILLTLEGDDPSEEGQEAGFVSLSHIQVLELLDTMLNQYQAQLPDDVKVFFSHYIKTLKRLTMQDKELVDLCKAIYRKHKDAIDLIVQLGATSKVLESCEQAVNEIIKDVAFINISHNRVWFIPNEMAKVEKPVLTGWPHLPLRLPVSWWFYYRKKVGKLQLTMEVGPIDDAELRSRLLRALQDGGFTFWEGAFRPGAKYTRVYTYNKKLKTNEDGEVDDSYDYISDLVSSMWNKAWADTSNVIDILSNFNWK